MGGTQDSVLTRSGPMDFGKTLSTVELTGIKFRRSKMTFQHLVQAFASQHNHLYLIIYLFPTVA